MRAGQLRHKVVIEQPTEAQAISGATTKTWSTFGTTRASINPLSGVEGMAAKERQATVTHEIKIRWLPGITTMMRVIYDSRFFYIKSTLDKDERRREMTLLCLEGVK